MTDRNRHIVLVTDWFHPKQGVAVNRMHGFVKYLDSSRFRISVITEHDGSFPTEDHVFNADVYRFKNKPFLRKAVFRRGESRILHLLKVFWNLFVNRLQGVVDRSWVRGASGALERLHDVQPIDILISSYAPAATHMAAYRFCKLHPSVKWVADMRDEMSENPHLSKRERLQLSAVEGMVNSRADAVTSVSGPIVKGFKKLLGSVKLFEEVRNGFDHDIQAGYSFGETFTISYSGSFYGQRKPITFFQGLERFRSKYQIPFRLRFVGTHRNFTIPERFESYCDFIGHVSAEDAILEMAKADANLLVLPIVSGKGAYSGKIFEYISVAKPIIAIVDPDDVAAELIREMNAGFVAGFNDVEAIAKAIESAYLVWLRREPLLIDAERVRSMHRRFQVARLQELIDKL